MRILIAEDNEALRATLICRLKKNYDILGCSNGKEALSLLHNHPFDLIILDLVLPGLGGLDLLKQIRAEHNPIPVIITSAKCSNDDRIKGLEYGANDYLIKPFHYRELELRIRNQLHPFGKEYPEILQIADLIINTEKHSVQRGRRKIHLAHNEYKVLEYLMYHAGSVVSKHDLELYIGKDCGSSSSNEVNVYICLLRKKIDNPEAVKLIHTLHGVGYMIMEDILPKPSGCA